MSKEGTGNKSSDRAMASSEENEGLDYLQIGIAVLALGWGIYSLFSGRRNDDTNMMNAPGQPGVRISRDAFERNPSRYFRHLRKN